jgi:hypothetical protein
MEQLSDYKACASMGLSDVASHGLPGKISGHGSEVEGMVERGEIDQVRAYCEADCLNLFALYARWAPAHREGLTSRVTMRRWRACAVPGGGAR